MKSLYIPFKNYSTYVEIYKSKKKSIPLIMCHGGPGSGRYGFIKLAKKLQKLGQTVILYDQLGAGNSIPEDQPTSLYNIETWRDEFFNLVNYLKLDEYYTLGHSYGGMLLIKILVENNPKEMKKAILSSTLYSSLVWENEAHRLIKFLSKNDQKAIKIAEESSNYDSLEFQKASKHYYKKFLKDDKKKPKDFKSGHVAYLTAWGPSEFKCLGNLQSFNYEGKLELIDKNCLILSGGNDESTPYINKYMNDHIKNSKWVLFKDARHATYVDDESNYIKVLLDFLNN